MKFVYKHSEAQWVYYFPRKIQQFLDYFQIYFSRESYKRIQVFLVPLQSHVNPSGDPSADRQKSSGGLVTKFTGS